MRKSNREITKREEIDKIIKKSDVCRIAFAKNNIPYLVPVSFGYDGKSLFIHTAKKGKKIDFIEENNVVCFEFDSDVETITDDKIACNWTTSYRSVIGNGKIIELLEFEEQEIAINQIMLHYSGKKWEFEKKMLNGAKLWKIEIKEITGKMSGY
jgi:hypothetical protein